MSQTHTRIFEKNSAPYRSGGLDKRENAEADEHVISLVMFKHGELVEFKITL